MSFLGRAISKLVVGPIKYRASGGYDAERYWRDRFGRYGSSLRGVGHEGLSETANEEMYADASRVFRSVVGPLIGSSKPKTLEIGCGSGFYTNLLQELGVSDYTGIDITDALFPSLQPSYPAYRFVQGDITKVRPEGHYNLVVMIDVTEHIVTRAALHSAIGHIKDCVEPGGYVIIGPQFAKASRRLFYVHLWATSDVDSEFDPWTMVSSTPFRNGELLMYRRPSGGIA